MKENENVRQEPKQRPKRPETAAPKRAKGKQAKKKNHELSVVTWIFAGLFSLLIGYFVYFDAVLAPDVINNPYNTRQESFADKVIRGSILASDGSVLASTTVAEDGTETREYPYGSVFAHVVGYSTRGKSGIENLANFELLTSNISPIEEIRNEMQEEKNPGDSVVTTLDVDLQQTAWEALGDYRGAAVVLEAKTGKVLAMVSKPDFDPNTLNEKWESLTAEDDTESALYNRAAQGLYAPGSTFKIVTLLEYLRENPNSYADFTFNCTGSLTEGNYTISCYNKSQHGAEDLTKAFAKSCNTAFASIGLTLDADRFTSTAQELLFNTDLPFDLPYSESSFATSSDDVSAERMMAAIGQGETLASPLHIALIASAIANDGVLMKPYLLDHVENAAGTSTVKTYSPKTYGSLMTSDEAAILKEYMLAVVESGTGSKLSDLGFAIAGKTGTAEYSTDKSKSHAWFVGFSDTGRSDIVVCVLVEEKGSGSEYAVPIARKIFSAWYENRAAEELLGE